MGGLVREGSRISRRGRRKGWGGSYKGGWKRRGEGGERRECAVEVHSCSGGYTRGRGEGVEARARVN